MFCLGELRVLSHSRRTLSLLKMNKTILHCKAFSNESRNGRN